MQLNRNDRSEIEAILSRSCSLSHIVNVHGYICFRMHRNLYHCFLPFHYIVSPEIELLSPNSKRFICSSVLYSMLGTVIEKNELVHASKKMV